MTDPVPDTKPGTRWFWVLILVALAVALVIFVLNADGDEELETIPDEAVTTTEERLNTDLGLEDEQEGLEQVNGIEPADAEPMMDGETETSTTVDPQPQ